MDASVYEIWYSDGKLDFHCEDTSDNPPFIHWAEALRSRIIAEMANSK